MPWFLCTLAFLYTKRAGANGNELSARSHSELPRVNQNVTQASATGRDARSAPADAQARHSRLVLPSELSPMLETFVQRIALGRHDRPQPLSMLDSLLEKRWQVRQDYTAPP